MTNGWAESADSWIADMGNEGDFGRKFVLDRPMLGRVRAKSFRNALDVGCGEGRFCRMLGELGIKTVGIDPTEALIRHARERDPGGDYRIRPRGSARFSRPLARPRRKLFNGLIDIADIRTAIAEMCRVLAPGGTLLIANLTSFNTAGQPNGWVRDADGDPRFFIAINIWNGARRLRPCNGAASASKAGTGHSALTCR